MLRILDILLLIAVKPEKMSKLCWVPVGAGVNFRRAPVNMISVYMYFYCSHPAIRVPRVTRSSRGGDNRDQGKVPSARNILAATITLLQVIGFLEWICCMLGWHVCEGAKLHDWHRRELAPTTRRGVMDVRPTRGNASFVE